MKYLVCLIALMLCSCASGNYFGDAGKVYTGDKGYVHHKLPDGTWGYYGLASAKSAQALPECESPIKDMDRCLDALGWRQH